ncbi:amidohydrolase family protein [Methylobacter tundripaludum]|uniref:amidohydrolase family protein n=1 Tax=Methylobacter tundripaludum TaxID=173365 RepID=UPI001362EFEF|nr:amidohydrolase family protein [Methylobacter tundripaludum]
MSQFHGRLNDLDTHIQPSPNNYEIAAGEVGKYFADMYNQMLDKAPKEEAAKIAKLVGEESQEYTEETVWRTKGSAAPGAFSSDGRLKTLDYMGVNRSFIFSDPGIQGAAFANNELGIATMRHWNDFIIDFGKQNPNRLRSVAILNTHNIDVAIAEAKRVLKAGGRAFVLASSVPPGDASPADAKMDKLWHLIQEADATAILHAGGEHGFMASDSWSKGVDHLCFQPMDMSSEGEQVNTYMFSSMYYSPQNFLSTLVLGGVFERFPRLRFAVIELGAFWLAPMATHLDQVASIYRGRLSGALSMKPSEYIQRNVRVTPYRFEPVADYIERYGFEECYCYNSDFPHPEGGTRPIQEFVDHIDRLGQNHAEKFFVTNAEWVLPALN